MSRSLLPALRIPTLLWLALAVLAPSAGATPPAPSGHPATPTTPNTNTTPPAPSEALATPTTPNANTAPPAPSEALATPAPPLAPNADSPATAPRGRWQGASWGPELRIGLALGTSPSPLVTWGAALRLTSLLSLVDLALFVDTAAGSAPAADRRSFTLRETRIGLDLRLHPLFMRNLFGTFWGQVAAASSIALEVGVDLLALRGPATHDTLAALGMGTGLGVAFPLTRPNAATSSLWLDVGYRYRTSGFSAAPEGLRDRDQHVFLLALAWRFHDVSGVPLPVPPELNDRDP